MIPALTNYRTTSAGIELELEDGNIIAIQTTDAILLKDFLQRDRLKLEQNIFTEAPLEFDGDTYAVLRARTEALLERLKHVAEKRKHSLTVPQLAICPHCQHLHDSRWIEACSLNPLRNTLLKLPAPRQCAIAGCGNKAFEALSVAHESEPGAYIIRPLCSRCACLPQLWQQWIESEDTSDR